MECVEVLRIERGRDNKIKIKKGVEVKCKNYRGIYQQKSAHKISLVTIKAKWLLCARYVLQGEKMRFP